MKLGGKHAKQYGYSKYVGEEIKLENKTTNSGLELVTLKVKDVPFPVSLMVHKEDILNSK